MTNGKNWINGGIKWMDKEGAYFFQGSYWVHAWSVVNTERVKPGTVKSWKDYLKPEFKGRIAAYDPRSGGPGQAAAAYLVDVFGIDFLKQLHIGQEVVYTRDGRQLIEWLVRGNYDVALGGVQIDTEQFRTRASRACRCLTWPMVRAACSAASASQSSQRTCRIPTPRPCSTTGTPACPGRPPIRASCSSQARAWT